MVLNRVGLTQRAYQRVRSLSHGMRQRLALARAILHQPSILLLDEPGLNLHAMAQNDFLRFIDESLAPKHQVIYSTHSPFMINLDHLNRVRTVQDVDDRGTVISDDVLTNDQETLFPVQVALSYRMAQSLFLAPHCLMVNAPSDLIYLQVLGEVAAARNRTRLDPRWVIIPVGGADNLPTLVSLLGENYVSVAVLMDVTPASKERIEQAKANWKAQNFPKVVGDEEEFIPLPE